MENLPNEVMIGILNQLPTVEDMITNCRINKRWWDFCLSPATRRQLKFSFNDFQEYAAKILTRSISPDPQIIQFLLEYGLDPYTLFAFAIRSQYHSLYSLFLKYIPDVNRTFAPHNLTLLGVAADLGDSKLVQHLLQLGADPNLPSNEYLPLKWALLAPYPDEDTILLLLNAGSQYDLTELITVAGRHHLYRVITYLVDHNINVNTVDRMGVPLLSRVVNNPKMVQYLIDHGADVNLLNNLNRSPLECALRGDFLESAKILQKHGATLSHGPKLFTDSIVLRNHPLFQYLLTMVNVNQADSMGRYPLIVAVWIGDIEMVEQLLHHGANPNVVDSSGHSPLWYAVDNDSYSITRLLLIYGANPNRENVILYAHRHKKENALEAFS